MDCVTAVVLGSGLGGFADLVDTERVLPFSELEDFPVSTVEGHRGEFILGKLDGREILLMSGRVHYYEGYSMQDVVKPVRFMKNLGIRNLLLTNAAGGANPDFEPGDLMMITDHISCFVPSPLRGPAAEGETRFPDMTHVYDEGLMRKIRAAAGAENISLREGVYLQTAGPNYETPAEVRMYRSLGADALGMSTAAEAMTAHALGIRVAGISCITNRAAGLNEQPLSHEEVSRVAASVSDQFTRLVRTFLCEL